MRQARSHPGQARGGRRFGPLRTTLAWGVHFYTALGLVAAAGIAVLIVENTGDAFRWAFALMLIATLIDATDGTLARAVKIKEVLPNFDGRKLDDLVDFLTYTFLPLFLIWRAALLPPGHEYWLLLPLLASAYGFCQSSAKTDDGYFLGFPSYWNMVAFYLYALQPLPGWVSVALVAVLALLTFVPSRYLYATQRGRLNRFTNVLAALWTGLVVWILCVLPSEGMSPKSPPESLPRHLALLSLFFPVYYMAASWAVSCKIWRGHRRLRREQLRAALE
jgi:phosphatidylcholine synthase